MTKAQILEEMCSLSDDLYDLADRIYRIYDYHYHNNVEEG